MRPRSWPAEGASGARSTRMTKPANAAPGSYAERFLNDIFPRSYKSGVLSGERYASPGFAAREFDNVFARTWQVVGRTNEIPEAGDFITHELGRESFLVVRQQDGSVRAF